MTPFLRATRAAALLSALSVALTGIASADPAPGPIGYLDANGGFHALERAADADAPAATALYNGTIQLNASVRIASDTAHVARANKVRCTLVATISTVTGPGPQFDSITETNQVTVPIVSSAATCRIVIPYSWELYAGRYDAISMVLSVTAVDSSGNGRTRQYRLQPIAMPRDQTTTVIAKSVRL